MTSIIKLYLKKNLKVANKAKKIMALINFIKIVGEKHWDKALKRNNKKTAVLKF